eukprot:TRINITY_DN2590_c0_g1_i4.p1 TRINITY_DN2590_c0_g1~~TRINITY_DN2590_c0_g1_i4.p1  ORF type:complete len:109 (-),score=14.61 TRINITY_DN2590_c0_g1_i4:553-879(-)
MPAPLQQHTITKSRRCSMLCSRSQSEPEPSEPDLESESPLEPSTHVMPQQPIDGRSGGQLLHDTMQQHLPKLEQQGPSSATCVLQVIVVQQNTWATSPDKPKPKQRQY